MSFFDLWDMRDELNETLADGTPYKRTPVQPPLVPLTDRDEEDAEYSESQRAEREERR